MGNGGKFMSILAAMAVPHPPIILPEIGHGEEQKIQATTAAYQEVMVLKAWAISASSSSVVMAACTRRSPPATAWCQHFVAF